MYTLSHVLVFFFFHQLHWYLKLTWFTGFLVRLVLGFVLFCCFLCFICFRFVAFALTYICHWFNMVDTLDANSMWVLAVIWVICFPDAKGGGPFLMGGGVRGNEWISISLVRWFGLRNFRLIFVIAHPGLDWIALSDKVNENWKNVKVNWIESNVSFKLIGVSFKSGSIVCTYVCHLIQFVNQIECLSSGIIKVRVSCCITNLVQWTRWLMCEERGRERNVHVFCYFKVHFLPNSSGFRWM